ncbi:MAG: nucleotide exchange factor GrpE [bacterium]|nr:nucleotide exchange factor GrpE [bacterium]
MPDSVNGSSGADRLEEEVDSPEIVIDGEDEEIELIFEEDQTGEDSEQLAEDGLEDGSRASQLQSEIDELKERYLRKLAEFDNFRKRTERERAELQRTAGENVVRDLLPVVDNFDRALLHSDDMDNAGFRDGVEMISKQLKDVLQRQGLAAIDPVDEEFDPEFHEAVQRVEDSGVPPGTVVSVLIKGYFFGGKLIRPAMVGVSVESETIQPDPEPEVVVEPEVAPDTELAPESESVPEEG